MHEIQLPYTGVTRKILISLKYYSTSGPDPFSPDMFVYQIFFVRREKEKDILHFINFETARFLISQVLTEAIFLVHSKRTGTILITFIAQ